MDTSTGSTESVLLDRVIQGEKEAFEEIVTKYQSFCYTLALRILKNPMEAEEATQDSFIKAYRSLKFFNRKSKFSSWLYRITYNTSISYYRKQKKHETFEIVKYDRIHGVENKHSETLDKKRFLEEAISKLNEQDASIITLFYFEELSMEEIGKILALRPNLVKVKLHRARKKLANELRDILQGEVEQL